MEWHVTRFPVLPSTNDLALEWIRSGQARAGDVIRADVQTAGRGRPGRTWHSPEGALLFTAILPFDPERAGWTALATGIAVAQAVRELGAPAGVKWPNDVVLYGRKLAGILVETSARDLVAVGVGLNVANPPPADPELSSRTIRVADAAPRATVDGSFNSVLARLNAAWGALSGADLGPLRAAWQELDTTTGRRVRWSEEGVVGTVEGIAADGALLLRTDDGRSIAAAVGEVGFL